MIGTHKTTDENGIGITVRFRRVDGNVTILGIADLRGNDVWGQITLGHLAKIREEIERGK